MVLSWKCQFISSWEDKSEKKNTRGRTKKNSLGEDVDSVSDESVSDDLTKKEHTTLPDVNASPTLPHLKPDDLTMEGLKSTLPDAPKEDLTKNDDSKICPSVVQPDAAALPGEKADLPCSSSTLPHPSKDDLTKNALGHECLADQLKRSLSFIDVEANDTSSGVFC